MSQSPFPQDDFSAPPPQRKSRLWLGLGIGCGVMLLLCCGGFVALTYFGTQMAQTAMIQDPEQAAALGRGIAEIDMPPELAPKGAMDLKVPIIDKQIMKMAFYESADGQTHMILASFPPEIAADPDQMKLQIDQQMNQQGKNRNITITDSHQVEVTVRGQPTTFTIQHGTNTDTQAKVVNAMGSFQGKEGTAFMMFTGPADKYSDEQVEQIIRSIE